MNKLIFLGTGNALSLTRQMTAIALVVGDKTILIDCGDGMGTVQQLLAAGIDLSSVDNIFLTHAHGDHISGIANVLFSKLVRGRGETVTVYGHQETLKVAKEIVFDTHDFLRKAADRIRFTPVSENQPVSLANEVTLRTVIVPGQKDSEVVCFACRFDLPRGKSVVFTADMIPNQAFDALAKGVGVMIHECGGLDKDREFIHSVGHVTSKEAGEAASRAGAGNLILTHLGDYDDQMIKRLTEEARSVYSGPVLAAADLLEHDLM